MHAILGVHDDFLRKDGHHGHQIQASVQPSKMNMSTTPKKLRKRLTQTSHQYTEPSMEIFSVSNFVISLIFLIIVSCLRSCKICSNSWIMIATPGADSGLGSNSNPNHGPSSIAFADTNSLQFHKGLNKIIEIGNSGMFRPEMLEPMGLPKNMRVYGWYEDKLPCSRTDHNLDLNR